MSKSGAVSALEPGPDGAATVVPTFTPAQFERTLNTRAATSSVERRQRTMNVRALSVPPQVFQGLFWVLEFVNMRAAASFVERRQRTINVRAFQYPRSVFQELSLSTPLKRTCWSAVCWGAQHVADWSQARLLSSHCTPRIAQPGVCRSTGRNWIARTISRQGPRRLRPRAYRR